MTRKEIEISVDKLLTGQEDMFVRQLSKEEIEDLKATMGSFAFEHMGDEIYRLPGGQYTGKSGVIMFNENINNKFKKIIG